MEEKKGAEARSWRRYRLDWGLNWSSAALQCHGPQPRSRLWPCGRAGRDLSAEAGRGRYRLVFASHPGSIHGSHPQGSCRRRRLQQTLLRQGLLRLPILTRNDRWFGRLVVSFVVAANLRMKRRINETHIKAGPSQLLWRWSGPPKMEHSSAARRLGGSAWQFPGSWVAVLDSCSRNISPFLVGRVYPPASMLRVHAACTALDDGTLPRSFYRISAG